MATSEQQQFEVYSLTEDEHDAFSEAFNLGIGVAASSLSEMIDAEIQLSVPRIEAMRKIDAAAAADMEHSLSIRGVRERFSGPFSGSALLLFPQNRSLELVRLLLQQPDADIAFVTEMEQEALSEVGNIILNACLSTMASIMGDEIHNEIPEPVVGELKDVIIGNQDIGDDDYVLRLRVEFAVKHINLNGYIAFLMDIESLDIFRRKLAEYFGFAQSV